MVEGKGEFWDFRFESELVFSSSFDYTDLLLVPDFIWSGSPSPSGSDFRVITPVGDPVIRPKVLLHPSSSHPLSVTPSILFSESVRPVVPQVLTYLLLSNALFRIGVVDLNNQNKQLETLGTVFRQLLN
ncbi:hypothetical protein MEI_01058 [Bartonella vinsonii subsp. arupensis Pm136co]|uniref:Uncharacterized protein n=1 Tax=Bartonella vinsonii subsp. arupensis Pm136co TaxID=1094561 RepID=A0ABN0GP16_BARVI|nr:hypothetical protein [Bartonella vinsonii]EJF97946.1 hypothetical protein MEI_01058 [Bartonella vinsonii subsp. arupensis Pm136co]